MGYPLRRTHALGAVAAAALVSLSCSRCGAPSAGSAEELLPPGDGAVVTAPLGRLAEATVQLSASAAQLPGGDQLGLAARALVHQLGIDALSREGLLAAGLDPDRGAALALLPHPRGAQRPPWVAALPLTRPDLFTQRLDLLLQQRAGFPLRTEEARGGVKAVVFARPGLAERLGYGLVRGYALLSRCADPAAELAAAAARPEAQSLSRSPVLVQARQDLGRQDLMVLAPEASELLQRFIRRPLPGASAAGLSVLAGGATLRLRVAQALGGGPLTALNTLLPGPLKPPLLPVPQDALVVRAQLAAGQLTALLEALPLLAPAFLRLREELKARAVDLDQDLFAALEPGAALSAGLAAHANLGRAVDPDLLDLRTHSPFDLLRVLAVARTGKASRVRLALSAVAAALPALGASVTPIAAGRFTGCQSDAWRVRYPGGEGLEFGLVSPGLEACQAAVAGAAAPAPGAAAPAAAALPAGETALVYATGGGGNDGAALLAAKARPSGATGDAAVVAEIDLGLLAAGVRALPDSAYGSGPQVFVARSLVSQVIDPLQRLRGRLEVRPGARGVVVDLTLSLAAAK